MTKLSNEDQAKYERSMDMTQDLIEKMGDTWDGSNMGDVIFSIGVAIDSLCESNGYPQELANDIIGSVLEDDIDEELDEDDLEIVTSDGIDLDDDSLEFLKHLLSSKDNN